MGMTTLAIASAIGALTSTYGMIEQGKQAKQAEKAQDRARQQAEKEALKQGAAPVTQNETMTENNRIAQLRRGFLNAIKAGEAVDTSLLSQQAAGISGNKQTLG